MFNNLKNKLRVKVIDWLKLDRIDELTERIHKDELSYSKFVYDMEKDLDEKGNQIEALNRTLQSVVSLGADVVRNEYKHNGSWAVVCIEGKHNIVKFINLYGADYRYILDFLKQFECSRRVIDAPPGVMFEDKFVFKGEL